MKKTSLYIPPDIDAALAGEAARLGVTKAELVRRTLSESLAGKPRPRPSIGVFDGPDDLGRDTDRHLSETGFGES